MRRCGILSLVACRAAVYAAQVSESGTTTSTRILDVLATRKATVALTAPLGPEDLVVQSMPDASPAKWHLAHTSWFFDRFVLQPLGMPPVHADYDYLFNSYYDAVGARHPRSARGLLTRPTSDEVLGYRRAVDARLADLETRARSAHVARADVAAALELGLHHEQQHQELLLTDIKHLFSLNPLHPAPHPQPFVRDGRGEQEAEAGKSEWRSFEGGVPYYIYFNCASDGSICFGNAQA